MNLSSILALFSGAKDIVTTVEGFKDNLNVNKNKSTGAAVATLAGTVALSSTMPADSFEALVIQAVGSVTALILFLMRDKHKTG